MKSKTLATVAAIVLGVSMAGAASGTTINFDEFPATNNNSALTTAYSGLGVTFSATNSGIWGGNSNGNPGDWGLEGTNGPQFLGFNGANGYNETVTFSTDIDSASLDFSRSNGSSDGTITLEAFSGVTLVSSNTVSLGPINTWSTLSVSGVDISSIEWNGAGSGYHPYGVDNFVFGSSAVPEAATWAMMLMGFGCLGGMMRARRRQVAAAA